MYEINNIKIFNKDALELLKEVESNSIDLILTDPPYEISRDTNFQSGKGVERLKISMDFGKWDKEFDILDQVIAEYYRVLKKGGTLIMFYDLWKISFLSEMLQKEKFKQLRFIEWVKTNPVPINSKINYLTNAREIAITATKISKPTFNSSYDNGIYEYPIYHDKKRFHPTQKPIKLFEELIEKHSNEGDIVLDTFLGSGTTAIAAENTNRKFIGSELNEEYFLKTILRIEESISVN